MHDLVRVIFRCLESLDPGMDRQDTPEEEQGNAEIRMNVSPTRETPVDSIEQTLAVEASEREKTPVPMATDCMFSERNSGP